MGIIRRWRRNREARKIAELFTNPIFRVSRPGWQGTKYLIDPTNPGIAIANRRTRRSFRLAR